MGAPNSVVVIDDLTGGLNQTDPPMAVGSNQVVVANNVEWVRTKFGRRRRGSSAVTSTFSSGGPFTTAIGAMVRHVPAADESAAEVWAVDSTPIFGRKAASTQFVAKTPVDAMTGNAWDVTFATVDGCLFMSYQSAVNRLHLWDGTSIRRAGIDPGTNAPVALNSGSGTYAAVLRYYRVRFYNSTFLRVSEPTPSVAFTPAGNALNAEVTRPAAPGEGEDSWILEVSADNVTFYQLAAQVLGSPVYNDTVPPSSYLLAYNQGTITLSPLTGTFNVQKSYRFIAGANNRLLGFGTYQTGVGVYQNRIEVSGIVGAGTIGVFGSPVRQLAETVDTTAGWYIDLDEADSGSPTGLKGPVLGNHYAFKSHQMWELRPTGDSTRPFAATAISKTIGAVAHQAICAGEDQQGHEALYFWSHAGPYRYTVNGLEYIGRNIEGVFKEEQFYGDVNLDATIKVAHCVYHAANRQVYFWVSTSAANDPNVVLIYHTLTGGWSNFIGVSPARCSAMLPDTQGATMARVVRPHFAPSPVVSSVRVVKCDDSATLTDANSAAFAAQISTRPILPGGPLGVGNVGDAVLIARGTGASLTLKTLPNLSDYVPIARGVTVSLTPTAEEGTWITRRFEDSGLGEVYCAQYILLDSVAAAWNGDRLIVPVRPGGGLST